MKKLKAIIYYINLCFIKVIKDRLKIPFNAQSDDDDDDDGDERTLTSASIELNNEQ